MRRRIALMVRKTAREKAYSVCPLAVLFPFRGSHFVSSHLKELSLTAAREV